MRIAEYMNILTDILCLLIYQHSRSWLVMAISVRRSQKLTSVISLLLPPLAIYEADLVYM